jgi:hypothetical protein
MKDPKDLKPTDLCVFVCGTYSYPVIFHSLSYNKTGGIIAIRGFGLTYIANKISWAETKYLNRVQGDIERKVWKITEDCLTENQLANYKKWKSIYEGISV